jgi:methyl-accepting chemotaxis protein
MKVSILGKLLGIAGLLLTLMVVIGVVSITNLGAVNAKGSSMYRDNTVPINQLSVVSEKLVDLQRLGLRGILKIGKTDEEAKVDQDAAADNTQIAQALSDYSKTHLLAQEKTALAKLQQDLATYEKQRQQVRQLANAGDKANAASTNENALALFKTAHTDAQDLRQMSVDSAQKLQSKIASRYRSSRLLIILFLAAAIVLGAIGSFWVARNIKTRVQGLLNRLQSLDEQDFASLGKGLQTVAAGDLSYDVAVVTEPLGSFGSDEIGELSSTFNSMLGKAESSVESYNAMRAQLVDMIGEISRTSGNLASASQQMALTSEEAGKAVGEIARAVGEVAAGTERQVRMVEQAKTSTQETSQAAEQALAVAQEGVAAADQATTAMQALRGSTADVTSAIRGLAGKSEQIGGIVETITGIAGQTNLLALNAAIEAARAGEQGRGFAVVAEEVRKLAEESQHAAASIAELIAEIQTETEKTVQAVESGSKRTEESTATVEAARSAFQQIGASVEDMRGRIAQIVEATNEVAAVAEQSSASTEEVSATTEQTSASAQEIAASAQELASTADRLQQLVGQFRV